MTGRFTEGFLLRRLHKGDERQRPCVGDEAARPSPDKTKPTQGAARRATAIPTTHEFGRASITGLSVSVLTRLLA
jgi:hypothetical protein